MKKIFNKIGQVLQLVLAAPVKLPGKVGYVLKYLALGFGIMEKVLDDDKPLSAVDDKAAVDADADMDERSHAGES